MAENYAIVESGGKQYRAEKGTTLVVDRLNADEGSKINLRAVMFRGDGDDVIIGGDKLEKVKVEATVTGHERGDKIRIFKYRAKKGYRKRQGHRSELTRLEVTEVKMLTRKPAAAEGEDAAKDEAPAKDEAATEAARRSRRPKPAAKKPAADEARAAKKPAAKKPAAKKPAKPRRRLRRRARDGA